MVGALQLSSEIFDRCAQAASEKIGEKVYFFNLRSSRDGFSYVIFEDLIYA